MPARQIAPDTASTTLRVDSPATLARRRRARLLASLSQVRLPIVAAMSYAVLLLAPDQSADAARTTFEDPTLWRYAVLLVWWGMLTYLSLGLAAFAAIALHGYGDDTRGTPMPGADANWRRRLSDDEQLVGAAIAASPFLVTIMFLLVSHSPNWSGLGSIPLSVMVFCKWCAVCAMSFPRTFMTSVAGEDGKQNERWSLLYGAGITAAAVVAAAHGLSKLTDNVLDLPPVLLLTAWVITAIAVLLGLRHWSRRSGWPVLKTVAALSLLWSLLNLDDHHRVRTMPRPADAIAPMPLGAAVETWLDARAPEIANFAARGAPYPVFVVAAEGGASRAAYMTAAVLEQLRFACPAAIDHVFAVIGVSGGSVGAVLANAALREDHKIDPDKCSIAEFAAPAANPAASAAGADLLRPLLLGSLFVDLPIHFLPTGLAPEFSAARFDRAQFLESGIADAWRRQPANHTDLDQTAFSALWSGPGGAIPGLILLGTDVDSGRRIAASHFIMPHAGQSSRKWSCAALADPLATLPERTRLVGLGELIDRDVSATTAAVLSARFPGLTPAGTVKCSDRSPRLVDGGYFENSGLTTASDIFTAVGRQLAARHAALVVISIENSDATVDWRFASGKPPRPPSSFLGEFLSPVRAIAGTRQARADLARQSLEARISPRGTNCFKQACLSLLRFRLYPCQTPLPLGWSLSSAARKEIDRQLFAPDVSGGEPKCVGSHGRRGPTGGSNLATFKAVAALVKPGAAPPAELRSAVSKIRGDN